MSFFRSLLALLLMSHAAIAATFKNDATAVSVSGAAAGHSFGVAILRASDNSYYSSGSYTPVGGFVNGATKTITSTQLGFDFFVVVFSAPSSLWTRLGEGGKMHRWISAYEVNGNEPQSSSNGPYGPNGPTDPDGNPADPQVGGPPTKSYKATVTVGCPANSIAPKSFLITAKEGTVIIQQFVVTVIPGEVRTITLTNDAPFTLSAQEVIPKNFNPRPESPGGEPNPDNPEDWKPVGPENVVNAEGQADPPPASGGPEATNQKTAQNGTPSQPPVSDKQRPGDPEGNADARNAELRGEIQRLTDQVKTSGDGMKAGIDDTNRELRKLTGGGSGGGTSGANFGTPSESALGFATGIGNKAAGLGSALGNLLNASGLGANSPGAGALSWQVPVMGDTVTVSVEEHAAVFDTVRHAIMWVASAFFAWRVFSIMRGAFVDEGA